jgi:hypothetical protein
MSKIETLHIATVAMWAIALQEFVSKRLGSDPKRYIWSIGRTSSVFYRTNQATARLRRSRFVASKIARRICTMAAE